MAAEYRHTLCQNKIWRQINCVKKLSPTNETQRGAKRNLWHLLFVKDMQVYSFFFPGTASDVSTPARAAGRERSHRNTPGYSIFHFALKEISLLQFNCMQVHFRKPLKGMLCSVLNPSTRSVKELVLWVTSWFYALEVLLWAPGDMITTSATSALASAVEKNPDNPWVGLPPGFNRAPALPSTHYQKLRLRKALNKIWLLKNRTQISLQYLSDN